MRGGRPSLDGWLSIAAPPIVRRWSMIGREAGLRGVAVVTAPLDAAVASAVDRRSNDARGAAWPATLPAATEQERALPLGLGSELPVLATYRIQLTPEFGFDQLRSRLPFIARFG